MINKKMFVSNKMEKVKIIILIKVYIYYFTILEWSAEFCETVEKENDNGEKYSTCKCHNLKPTTVVNDVENIYQNSEVKKVFSTKGLK